MEKGQRGTRRGLLIIVLGIGFLVLMTLGATVLDAIVPHHPTAPVQSAQVGPYQVTLQVSPNPPLISGPAALSFRVLAKDTQQPIANARVTIDSSMETMDMGTDHEQARWQPDGVYLAHTQFAMGGPWQVRVTIAVAGKSPQTATFEVSAQ